MLEAFQSLHMACQMLPPGHDVRGDRVDEKQQSREAFGHGSEHVNCDSDSFVVEILNLRRGEVVDGP